MNPQQKGKIERRITIIIIGIILTGCITLITVKKNGTQQQNTQSMTQEK